MLKEWSRKMRGRLAIYEYTITFIDDETGETRKDTLVGYSTSHAKEEAWYECSTQILKAKRGEFLYWQ